VYKEGFNYGQKHGITFEKFLFSFLLELKMIRMLYHSLSLLKIKQKLKKTKSKKKNSGQSYSPGFRSVKKDDRSEALHDTSLFCKLLNCVSSSVSTFSLFIYLETVASFRTPVSWSGFL